MISRREFLDEFEISPATFKRDLDMLRDRFHVEIEYSRERRGYCIDESRSDSLPGPMYTTGEIDALLLMQDLLMQLQPGLLEQYLGPVRDRLQTLLGTRRFAADQIRRRIRILQMPSRPVNAKCFQCVSMATLSRRRLQITYRSRSRGENTVREISPQRLVYYRANWYLDSWCHLRNDMRSFALDMVGEAEITDTPADEIADDVLNEHLGRGYGIFAGAPKNTAVLRFEPHIAQWVSREIWHRAQEQEEEPDGHLILRVPYSEDYELTMDILRYGADVEVLAPEHLRKRVREALHAAAARYQTGPKDSSR